ncbi:MAG: ExbD/TolR family protein [Rhodothermales bacterium]
MRFLSKRSGNDADIPTSSMADIAFLLLIFFLVTTTLDVDTGIGMVLPPELDHPPHQLHERNMFKILIDTQGMLLVEGKPLRLEHLRDEVKRHVMNCAQEYGYGCSSSYAESPTKAVVSIKSTRATPYRVYLDVLDEVWMAYFEIWDREARRLGFANYEAYRHALREGQANDIRQRIKPQISIAEPEQ